jgi:activator of HSP90 ATPase
MQKPELKRPSADPYSNPMTRRNILFGGTLVLGSTVFSVSKARARAPEEISHSAESIHDEVVFKAPRKRVYEALTDAAQFHKVVLLSKAAATSMIAVKSPAQISRDPGGTFAIFGGYVTGRHIELVPGERIVQAWRNGSWKAGIYSIVKFELTEDAAGTRLIFDHTGFPIGDAQHLAEGWRTNYWEPLAKFLAQ